MIPGHLNKSLIMPVEKEKKEVFIKGLSTNASKSRHMIAYLVDNHFLAKKGRK